MSGRDTALSAPRVLLALMLVSPTLFPHLPTLSGTRKPWPRTRPLEAVRQAQWRTRRATRPRAATSEGGAARDRRAG